MSRADFYESDLNELIEAITAHYEQEQERERLELNIARWQVYHTLIPHDTKNKIKSVHDICIFDWEHEVKAEREAAQKAIADKAAATLEKWEQYDKQKKWKSKPLSIKELQKFSN